MDRTKNFKTKTENRRKQKKPYAALLKKHITSTCEKVAADARVDMASSCSCCFSFWKFTYNMNI
jgi:hypothetical protein